MVKHRLNQKEKDELAYRDLLAFPEQIQNFTAYKYLYWVMPFKLDKKLIRTNFREDLVKGTEFVRYFEETKT